MQTCKLTPNDEKPKTITKKLKKSQRNIRVYTSTGTQLALVNRRVKKPLTESKHRFELKINS
jgi:hypothetical protein